MNQALKLGKSEVHLSPLIMGTWQAGGAYWLDIDEKEVSKAIRTAFEHGITSFDTAEEYGEGKSESLIGQALKDVRDQVQICSKVFSNHLAYKDVIKACESSLKALNTDYLDLYQIHWPSGSWGSDVVPIAETLDALNILLNQGKIKAIGVSNFTLEQLEEAQKWADISSIQPSYSLFWRYVDKHLRPYCDAHQISILAYSPLAQGLLTGKFKDGHRFQKGDNRRGNKLFREPHFERALLGLDHLKSIAAQKKISLAQLALAWTMAQKNTFPIAGARNCEQVMDNAAAMNVALSQEELKHIDIIGQKVAAPFEDDPLLWHWEP